MAIEISKESRQRAIASIERWFEQNMDEPIGNVSAGALLGFFLDEVGPLVYNAAVRQAQDQLRLRIDELDIELHEDEFDDWPKVDAAKKKARK
jgi:uncharacterized protein (DUF2164 family)